MSEYGRTAGEEVVVVVEERERGRTRQTMVSTMSNQYNMGGMGGVVGGCDGGEEDGDSEGGRIEMHTDSTAATWLSRFCPIPLTIYGITREYKFKKGNKLAETPTF